MRPDRDHYFTEMAKLVASRATCLSRKVGCVLINERRHVIATGYNGVPSGMPHCYTCTRRKSGDSFDNCMAIHAEMNALLQCGDVYQIHTAYCTTSPCIHCMKLLMNTSCKRLVYVTEYTNSDHLDLWLDSGREIMHHGTNDVAWPT